MSGPGAEGFSAAMRRVGVLAILRGVPSEDLRPLAHTLLASGLTLLEVALSDPGGLEQLEALASELGNDALIGAGTVTTQDAAASALRAGARFLVTPHVAPEVNAFASAKGVEVLGGALTPTELAAARRQGVALVKIFPAGPLGAGYLSALLGPFPDAGLVAVGGVHASNAEEFIRAGAAAIGVGSALAAKRGGFDEKRTAEAATQLLAAVGRGREARS